MGNHKLRQEVARKLDALGGYRLYEGSANAARRVLIAWRLRGLLNQLSFKVGDVIHDCDGFNHRISEINPEYWSLGRDRSTGRFISSLDFWFEDDRLRCGCSIYIEPPQPAKGIEAYHKAWIEYQWEHKTDWANDNYHRELHRRLVAGEPICDKEGILLPELRGLSRQPDVKVD